MEFELRQDVLPPLTFTTTASSTATAVTIIAAHSDIVCARCPWLRRCLRASGMQEALSNRIVLHDTQPDIFRVFLQFLYSGLHADPLESSSPPLTTAQLADLLLLADRYECADLVAAVEAVLTRRLDDSSAVALLGLADKLGGEVVGGLRRAAFDYLAARPHLISRESLMSDTELTEDLR